MQEVPDLGASCFFSGTYTTRVRRSTSNFWVDNLSSEISEVRISILYK